MENQEFNRSKLIADLVGWKASNNLNESKRFAIRVVEGITQRLQNGENLSAINHYLDNMGYARLGQYLKIICNIDLKEYTNDTSSNNQNLPN